MVLAVNLYIRSGEDETAKLLETVVMQLMALHPEISVQFFSSQPDSGIYPAPNKKWTCIGPSQLARIPGYYAFRLKQKLNQLKPDVVLHADGFLLSGCPVRQYVLFPFAEAAMLGALRNSYQKSIRKGFSKITRKAEGIISFRPDAADFLQTLGVFPESNLHVLPWPGLSQKEVVKSFDKEQTRREHTEGREYFVCIGGIGRRFNHIQLLKAFSLFKARQKSNMLLVLLLDQPDEELSGNIAHYRYKSELRLIAGTDDLTRLAILHAAYAWVSAATACCILQEIVIAMQLGVPVLHGNLPGMTALFPDALLTFNPEEPQDIAGKMMFIYKDENYRNALIKAGFHATQKFQPQTTATELFRLLQPASGLNLPR